MTDKKIIAIRGSKGGVGTSMITTNLGIFLAQIGKRVLLVDSDFNNCSLHSWLGGEHPTQNIAEIFHDDDQAITNVAISTQITGLYLLAGSLHALGDQMLGPSHCDIFFKKLNAVDVDYILIDLPNDLHYLTFNVFCRADYSILVTLPLPDSVEATHRFIIASWIHSLEQKLEPTSAAKTFLADVKSNPNGLLPPRKITKLLKSVCTQAYESAQTLSTEFHPQIIVNQIKMKEDEELGKAMISASIRWLGVIPLLLGNIGWDDNVWLSQRRSKPLLIDFARSRACKDLEQIVRKIMSRGYKDLTSPTLVPPDTEKQNYYELLDVYPGASEEEVRRAYKQITTWFSIEGMAVRGAATQEELSYFEALAEEAHANLIDKSTRREYDRTHFPDGFASIFDKPIRQRESIAGPIAVTQESLPVVELTDDQFVDGIFLSSIRKIRSVELVDISNRAKVSVRYLKAIEEERFQDLPAPVFTRGFVMEFARFLKIDPKRAASDFMHKYETFLEKRK